MTGIVSISNDDVVQETARKATSLLGKDDFLKLLVTQLRYQDPMEPVSNENMLAQLAQFSSLEQMNNVSSSMEGMQAYSLIGKKIYAEPFDTATNQYVAVSGTVKIIRKEAGVYYADVDTGAVDPTTKEAIYATVKMSDIKAVTEG